MQIIAQIFRYFELIRDFDGAQAAVHFVQQSIALTTRSAAIDLCDDVVFGARQVRIPVDLPFLCHQLSARSGVSAKY